MARYVKKPIVVEAEQYFGQAHEAVCIASFPEVTSRERVARGCLATVPHVHTLEGPLRVSHGDWIIRGVKGEFYSCKPDVFEATYDPA